MSYYFLWFDLHTLCLVTSTGMDTPGCQGISLSSKVAV